jgi:N-acetylneuraminic acid mutarotase
LLAVVLGGGLADCAEEVAVKLPDLPHPVTSFGGAVIGDNVYIYGGHAGDPHDYYIEGQSKSLWRLNVNGQPEWKELAQGPSLQGLAMVSHNGKLYRLGGFTAKNKKGEDKDLWTVDSAASFDLATNQWTDLPALPEPRSSFDAAVADGKIFVIGGWQLQGDADSVWHKTAYELDLSQAKPQWKAIAEPPFQRRALSVAEYDNKIYAIGGMTQDGPSTEVHIFDVASGKWSEGPALPGKGMEGFGSSAFAVGGKLYVSTFSGLLYRLSDDGKSWEKVQKLERDRFFHRMLPIGENRLVFIGGASMASGKFAEVDVIELN